MHAGYLRKPVVSFSLCDLEFAKNDFRCYTKMQAHSPPRLTKKMHRLFGSKLHRVDAGFIIHNLPDLEKAEPEMNSEITNVMTGNEIKNELTMVLSNIQRGCFKNPG